MSSVRAALVVCLIVLTPASAWTQDAPPDPSRFAAEIKAFAAWDARNSVPANAVLFVGSSSIRLWATAAAFPGLPVINRGFGGSQIADVNHYVQDTVLKYAPAIVVFYAGDNDINDGKSVDRVFDDYRAFVARVMAARRSTHIVFISIKPSVARWKLWPRMQAVNERIRSYSAGYSSEAAAGAGRLHFVDIATPMLGPAETMPAASLFVEDGLHMTEAGYAIWTRALTPLVNELRDVAP